MSSLRSTTEERKEMEEGRGARGLSNEYPTPQRCGRSAWRDLQINNQKSVAPFAQSMITRLILNN